MMKVLIIGGRGFVGKRIFKSLSNDYKPYTFDRHEGGESHIKGSILSSKDLDNAILKVDTVINLVGLSPVGDYSYEDYFNLHVNGVSKVIESCKKYEIKRYIHMGALGYGKDSLHPYLKTKYLGIMKVKNSKLKCNIINPSLIFDSENELIRTFQKASIFRIFPKIMTLIQPIYLGDVSEVFRDACLGKIRDSEIEIAGPDKLPIIEMAKLIFKSKNRGCIGIPLFFVKPFIWLFFNSNKYKSLFLDNTSSKNLIKDYIKKPVSLRGWLGNEK
jgi:nucleoside-diphosphate-sugar epimerase